MLGPLDQDLHLDILQTCRQIYHEAVLKPFALNEFRATIDNWYSIEFELQHMLDGLCPVQARAIKHLPSSAFVSRL